MTIISDRYSAQKAAQLCGFGSVAMLDYLKRSGVFVERAGVVKRRGKGRRYDFRDLLVLKAIKRLLDSGASVSSLKKALTELQKYKWSADPATLENPEGTIRFMVASADRIYLAKNAEFLIDLSNSGQLTFSFILDLERLHKELCRDLGFSTEQSEFAFSA